MNSLKGSFKNNALALFIEFSLAFLIIFSPFIHGGVTFFPLAVIQLTGLLIFFFFIARLSFIKENTLIIFPLFPLGLILAFSVIQTINIPAALLSLFSPSTVRIFHDFLVIPANVLSITICPNLTWHLLLQLTVCFLVFFVVVNYISTEARLKRVALLLIITGVIYSLIGIIKRFYTPDNSFSTFTNRNHFAAFIQMIIYFTLGYSFSIANKGWRIICLFLVSIMIAALFYSTSRVGSVCFFIGILLIFVLLRIKNIRGNLVKSFFILSAFISVLIIIIGIFPLLQRPNIILNPLAEYRQRLVTLKDTLGIIRDFPLVGSGLGTFSEISPKYKMLYSRYDPVFAHNEPAQLFSETGIVGVGLVLIFVYIVFKETYSIWLKRRNNLIVFTVMGGLIGLVLVLLHSFFDFVLHSPPVLFLFFIITGVIYRGVYVNMQQADAVSPKSLTFNEKPSLKILFIFLSLFLASYLAYSIFIRYQAEAVFAKINEQKISEKGLYGVMEYKKLLKKIDRAISLNPIESRYYYKKGNIFAQLAVDGDLIADLRNLDEFGTREQLLDKAVDAYSKAIFYNPTKADYHLKLGWIYKNEGEADLAKIEFRKAHLLDPTNKVLAVYLNEYSNLDN